MITDDTIEIGEATLATLGMTNILTGEVPRIGVGKQREILDIGKRIDALADDFVNDRLPRKLSMPRPFTYRKMLDTFTKPIPTSTTAKLMKAWPHDAQDAALSFITTLQGAYKHVADMLPVSDYNTYLGPKRIMPTSDKTFTFFLNYWIVDHPLIAFQLMQMGALLPEQVSTLLEFFPSLHNYMKKAIFDAMVKRSLREPNFINLPPRADRGLATFKQQRVVPFGANIHDIAPKPAKPAASPEVKTPVGLQTAGQKAAGL